MPTNNIENTDQDQHRAEDAAEAGFAEEKDLGNSNENEHQSHENVHAGRSTSLFWRDLSRVLSES